MTREEQATKLAEILGNMDGIEQLKKAGSVEDVQAILTKLGMEVSMDDAQGIVAAIMNSDASPETEEGELKDSELQEVAGGSLLAILTIGGAAIKATWEWAKGMQDENSTTYKATTQIVNFWSGVFNRKRRR